jgi:hypothetical protein
VLIATQKRTNIFWYLSEGAMVMNFNEVLALDKASQKHWIVEQEGYADTYSEAESAESFVDIFEDIPAVFSESFIEELALEEVISNDRFLNIQKGLRLTYTETDVIKKELAQDIETILIIQTLG